MKFEQHSVLKGQKGRTSAKQTPPKLASAALDITWPGRIVERWEPSAEPTSAPPQSAHSTSAHRLTLGDDY